MFGSDQFLANPTFTRMISGACEPQASQPVEHHGLKLLMLGLSQTRNRFVVSLCKKYVVVVLNLLGILLSFMFFMV